MWAATWRLKCPDPLNALSHVTFVWFLCTVNSAVYNEVFSQFKLFVTNSTFKRFLSWMTSSVSCQVMNTVTTSATICALVFTTMKIHMELHAALRWKTFLTLSIGLDCAVFYVPANTVYRRLYGRRFLYVKRPNQQYQSTEGESCKGKNKNTQRKHKLHTLWGKKKWHPCSFCNNLIKLRSSTPIFCKQLPECICNKSV